MGVSISSVVADLSEEFAMLKGTANIIAWPAAYYFMKKWIQSFSFHTNIGSGIFITAGLIAIAAALLTTGYQALKAAAQNPVENLKYK